jgi:hypothetical protein
MTATTVNSENVTNFAAKPRVYLDRKNGTLKVMTDQIAAATTSLDEVGDAILIGILPSNAILKALIISNDDLDAHATPTLDIDVGIAYAGTGNTQKAQGNSLGDTIDANAFASDSAVFVAAATTDFRFTTLNITTLDQELWQLGGLSADPGGQFVFKLTVGTAAGATPAAGDITLTAEYY